MNESADIKQECEEALIAGFYLTPQPWRANCDIMLLEQFAPTTEKKVSSYAKCITLSMHEVVANKHKEFCFEAGVQGAKSLNNVAKHVRNASIRTKILAYFVGKEAPRVEVSFVELDKTYLITCHHDFGFTLESENVPQIIVPSS